LARISSVILSEVEGPANSASPHDPLTQSQSSPPSVILSGGEALKYGSRENYPEPQSKDLASIAER
jgi:hypothetical protein